MKKIDDSTYMLSDGSILNFYDDGTVDGHMSRDWKVGKEVVKKSGTRISTFKFSSKQQAISVWRIVDKMLKQK